MKSREEIIVLLKNLLELEEKQERDYYQVSRNIRDNKMMDFFQRIRHNKNTFCSNLRKEIHDLEQTTKEISEDPETDFFSHSTSYPLPPQEFIKNGPLQKCYYTEQKNLQLYNYLLSKIFIGRIREILLAQKHFTQMNLNQLEKLIQKPKIKQSYRNSR